MDAKGLGRKLLLIPSGDPRRTPEKQTVGTATASQKMLILQALSSSLNAGAAKGGLPGPSRGFCPPVICPPERPRPFTHSRFDCNPFEPTIEHKLFLFSNFSEVFAGAPRISHPKSRSSLGVEEHPELFGPQPFTWKSPTPPEAIWTPKFEFVFLFLA